MAFLVLRRKPVFARLLLFLLTWTCRDARAQFSGATVLGVVQDASNAAIPDAKLKLINTATGAENDSETNREGGFVLPGVIVGSYTLQIESAGFATTQVRGIVLDEGDTKNLLIRMKVGPVTETVSVDASGLVINTTTAAVGMVADRKLVSNLPLNGRSFRDLISLTPGIVTQSPQAGSRGNSTVGEFSVNGQQPGSNSFFVDGVSANISLGLTSGNSRLASTGSIAGTTALGTTQTLVSVDALEEFRVLTSTYSAEYGRTPGGQFNFVTRSGADGFHGSAYDYYRHDTLNSADHFQSFPGSSHAFTQFNFGGTLGGPLALPWIAKSRSKSFVFGSYEGLILAQPTPALFEYNPSFVLWEDAPPETRQIIDLFPAGGSEIVDGRGQRTGLSYLLFRDVALPSHLNATSVRFDQTVTPKSSFFVRYAATPSYGRTEQLTSLSENRVRSDTVTLGSTMQFTNGRSNEFRVGYVGSHSNLQTNIEPYFPNPEKFDLVSLLGVPANYGSVRGQVYLHADGAGDTMIQTDQATGSLEQWNIRDTFGLPERNHLIRIGFDERRLGATVTPTPLSVGANFFSRSSLTQNSVSNLVVSASTPASPQIHQFSAYIDDSWKAFNALTLSFGLRWEVNPAPTGKNGQDALTALGSVASPQELQLAPRGTPLWHTTWFNLAPRVGAAWIADNRSGRELVVRGGAGVFFDTSDQPALNAFRGAGFYASQAFFNVPLPVTMEELNVSHLLQPPYTNTTVFAFPRHLQAPYALQWNLAIERSLGKNQSLTFSYVAANGRRLLNEQRRDVRFANPNFGDVSYFPGGVTSNYQGLQMRFQRTFSKGIEALASYTWAHSLDYGSTAPQFPLRYATSNLDVRHNLEAGFTWTLPGPPEKLVAKILLGHWSVDGRLFARTAFPVDLSGNFFFDAVTSTPYFSGVDLIPKRQLYYHDRALAGGRGFNGGPTNDRPLFLPAFALPVGQEPGNAPRNLVRGFGAVQANVSAKRDFRLYDRLHLQTGVDVFNVANHPNFGYVDPYLADSVFGQATRLLNQSFGSTGSLYQEGGPRSTQFHVRFVF